MGLDCGVGKGCRDGLWEALEAICNRDQHILDPAVLQFGHPDIALPPGPGANDYADPALAFPVLLAAGFGECCCATVAAMWRVDDPGAPYDFFREGTARDGALLRPQPDENAAAIPAAVVAQVLDKHGAGPVWNVPIPAVVTAAVAV